ncbi:MAG TPA: hypothetical protein PLZ84_07395 [Clostridia bacterium]|nr:hypothetical protein [Clostridia bacterium]
MNYFDIVRQIDEEYRLKRRKAEFDATVRLQRIIKDHPEIDAADTALRRAMREYGWGNISKEDVMRAKAAFETALALKNIDIRVIQPQYECDICKDTGKTDSGRCRCFL